MNKGLQSAEVARVKELCKKANRNFIYAEDELEGEDPSSSHFYFVGKHEGKEVVFDAFLYTLEMEYFSLVFELAKERVLESNPKWTEEMLEEGGNEAMEEAMEQAMSEIEEEDEVLVQEFVDVDDEAEYGISIDVCLNVPEVDAKVISKFVNEYTAGSLKLDATAYSFEADDEE